MRREINRNINRIRRDIRIYARQLQAQIEADEDCSAAAQLLMRAQADLKLYLDRRESLNAPAP